MSKRKKKSDTATHQVDTFVDEIQLELEKQAFLRKKKLASPVNRWLARSFSYTALFGLAPNPNKKKV